MEIIENTSPYSFGTFMAVTTIDNLIKSTEQVNGSTGVKHLPYAVDTILINVDTLVRNLLSDKSRPIRDYKAQVEQECLLIIEEVRINFDALAIPPANAHVIFYTIDHRKAIPKPHKRELTELQNATENEIRNISKVVKNKVHKYGSLTVITYSKETPINVQSSLREIIHKADTSRRVVMVSHVPLDFHAYHECLTYRLVESHTGKVVWPKELGKKVFSDDNIPFIPETHVLLGDKSYILPSLGIKEKRTLKELAANEKWNMRTDAFVRDSLRSNKFEIPFKLFP